MEEPSSETSQGETRWGIPLGGRTWGTILGCYIRGHRDTHWGNHFGESLSGASVSGFSHGEPIVGPLSVDPNKVTYIGKLRMGIRLGGPRLQTLGQKIIGPIIWRPHSGNPLVWLH